MMIPMSRKSYVLGEIGGVECRYKLFDFSVIWIINMEVKITSAEKFMRSSSCKREERVVLYESTSSDKVFGG
jgi:hypothetical protein